MPPKPTYRPRAPELLINRNWLILLIGFVSVGFAFREIWLAILPIIALRALRGPKETIEAFFILGFMLLGNRLFILGQAGNLRYFVFAAGFLSVLLRRRARNSPLSSYLLFFSTALALLSLFSSRIPAISLLKTVSFLIGAYTIVEAFAQTRHLRAYWFRLINTFFLFIVLGSLGFLLIGFGFERNNIGFQGILTHPQTFGPVMAVIAAWFTGLWLGRKSPSVSLTLLVGLCFVFIYMSQARTGMAAVLLGGALAYWGSVTAGKKIPNQARLFQLGGVVAFGLLLLFLLNPGAIQQTIVAFVQKRAEGAVSLNEVFQESRGKLTNLSMENFREHPIAGIGLGIPSDPEAGRFGGIQYLWGIPVSASVEKGFMPTAVLEETGLIGAALTIYLLLLLIRRTRRFSFVMLWLLLSALFINIGEAVLFSLGGPGFFIWLVVGFTYSMDFFSVRRMKKRRTKKMLRKVRYVG